MITVACVLRSGGEYIAQHVAWLHNQVTTHLPGIRFVCFSDVDVPCERVHLVFQWPGWWSKLEICRTFALCGDVLFFDLDTVIVGDLLPLINRRETTALQDFNYRNERRLQSSVMYLTERDRVVLWEEFTRDPNYHMGLAGFRGDQHFIGSVLRDWQSWQEELPRKLVSFKIDLKKSLSPPPAGTAAVVFHGRPRPWQVPEATWIPQL